MAAEAAFDFREDERAPVLALRGDWTVDTIASLEAQLSALAQRLKPGAAVDVSQLGRFDVAGAYLVDRTFRDSPAGEQTRIAIRGQHANAVRLLQAARKAYAPPGEQPARLAGIVGALDRVGRAVATIGEEVIETVGFYGESLVVLARLVAVPRRIRWTSIVHVMETAGLNALPIVLLLSFFIGMVVAYLGARILGDFGASVFTVELVAFSVLREFGVVITAVILAGRTNSAFTAEIGAMKMRQEIDAMRVIGIDPMDALVAPRIIAMLVMTPILTFGAMMSGIFGGLLVCWVELDISPAMFFARVSEVVPAQHFWVGFAKAPVFALVLAIIGCKQGLSVGGDVGSLGKRVTTSVVQAIFMVITIDALFALWYLEMGW
ncbi:MAG TPA: ABC transporter permease [Vitreimonas sp.]|uniref:ABC transporter permease n=1 Tax=Vitreimonas sp. TaxID=3069702 RepID=UPI002D58A1DD|nr:ABC transporter permease [Vitreimonas sp.]HYD88732.1 ABC transporter permease [Vitreimonas sp.]